MVLERFKAKAEGVVNYFDEQAASMLISQALKQESRLKWYLTISGTLLILFAIASALQKNYMKMFLFLCTLHLHIIMVYRYKNIVGKPQWETPKEDDKR